MPEIMRSPLNHHLTITTICVKGELSDWMAVLSASYLKQVVSIRLIKCIIDKFFIHGRTIIHSDPNQAACFQQILKYNFLVVVST